VRGLHGLHAGVSRIQGPQERCILNDRLRIYLTGVGGQGTLTATTLLSRTAMDAGLEVVSGEIHGMAQRGGVVESTVLIGGWRSPTLQFGEADVILGFEALETLRALPYLVKGGYVLSSTEFVPPPSVNQGLECLPEAEHIKVAVDQVAKKSWFVPSQSLGHEAGSAQSGNSAMLGALCAVGILPFGPSALRAAIKKYMPAKLVDVNLRALELGVASVTN
jgi:indolepyruvate ferredoxin oxidoreductase beta subunit